MDPQQILQFPHMYRMFFAMDEAMTRLHYLLYRGSRMRQSGADGVIRYAWDREIRQGAAA